MVRRRLEWLLCWCALVAAVGYVHGHLLVDRSAKQRVQALLAHQNPISALRTSAPVSPLGVTRNGPAPAASSGSATSSRSGDGRSGGSSSSSSYADTVRLLYSARDAREARIREPRVTPVLSQELEDVRSANEHFLRIRTTARCRVPRTRVVHVKEFYSDPSKEYLPRCTILHRCGDDAGCCDSEQYQCVPRAVQEVTLHFYTIHLQNQNGGEVGLRNSVTKLLFPNHTECECQPVNDIPRTAARPSRIAHHSGEHNKVSLHAPSSEDPDMAAGSGMHEELPSGPLKGGPPNLERPLRGSHAPSLLPPELLLLLGAPPLPPPPHNNSDHNSGQAQKRHRRLGILGEARPRRKSRAVRG
ncbi:uncharacterized protein LOC119382589 isoform X2 [Rhipicephalus sanguineus]|uniref:uncharacterized protein LOC119382589 isoform X2 n=1 Tax=Rhipicephalus sanguineus TaxID=34632 RepID=UPI0020C286C4|nr:uncharacterized protein LOC119382589 isoform X2 [Rhipicephalus sanguineus]